MISPVESFSYAPPPGNELLEHLKMLQDNFAVFDTAKETVKGKPLFGGGPDNIISKEDLTLVAENKGQKFTAAEQAAARYLLDHPKDLAHLDTASAAGNHPSYYEAADDRIGQYDVNAAVRDAQNFADAQTFRGQQGTIAKNTTDDTEQAALTTLKLRESGVNDPDASQRYFVQTLKEHDGDAAWLQRFFGALGAGDSGSLLYDSLCAGGDARTAARDAMDSLFNAGMLNDTDLQAAHFKTTPSSSADFTLKNLFDADGVQRQIEVRHDVLDDSSTHPEDTTANDAYDSLLTLQSEPNASNLNKIAERYGIDPALLKGTIASEMDFDYDQLIDGTADGLWRNVPGMHPLGRLPIVEKAFHGPGVASVHTDGLKWAVDYLKQNNVEGADDATLFMDGDPNRDKGADFLNSAEAAAIYLAALTHVRKSHGASTTSATDMAVTWGAYRSGIKGVTPGDGGYSLEGFLNNQVEPGEISNAGGDPHVLIGGNAYQSEPYFAWLQSQG